MMNNKKDVLKTTIVLLIYLLVAVMKYFLGYRKILFVDISIILLLVIMFLIYFFIIQFKWFLKFQLYLSLGYGVLFGVLLPALEYINTLYTFISGLAYLLPMLFYFILIKKNKIKITNNKFSDN